MENSYRQSVEMQETPLNSLRIKVTERCPWQCAFCHNEGWHSATELQWGPKIEEIVELLRRALPSIKEIHYTGGEPTKNPELATITAGLSALGLEVKTTTNGQFSEDELRRLIESGIRSFNFSVHSLDPDRFLRFQLGRGVWWKDKQKNGALSESPIKNCNEPVQNREWAIEQINQQLAMIQRARDLGIDVKINTVISAAKDIDNAKEIFDWSKKYNIPLRLLNDLGNGLESINAIRSFIDSTSAKEVLRKVEKGTSACSTIYRTDDDYEFVFKQIRDFKLESMCRNCPRNANKTCEEQFYGVRLQQEKDNEFYVVLCIQENNEKTKMTVGDFLSSPQLKEIQSYLAS